MEYKEVVAHIRETYIEVRFRLGLFEYIHYRYAKGLITEQEAEQELGEGLNEFTLHRMEHVMSHVG